MIDKFAQNIEQNKFAKKNIANKLHSLIKMLLFYIIKLQFQNNTLFFIEI